MPMRSLARRHVVFRGLDAAGPGMKLRGGPGRIEKNVVERARKH